jgi:hypothetical protein
MQVQIHDDHTGAVFYVSVPDPGPDGVVHLRYPGDLLIDDCVPGRAVSVTIRASDEPPVPDPRMMTAWAVFRAAGR